ncbi:GNAT family N-acetyltransferase [Cohnella nanjingensis]|uniref:GNAT family N-acetyltransferase n=1 Tax=Cohnella nanjingensis TaxID=1387779 RepID=A0A7X0RUM3_9BACL|nr:GNAT family N-acetyltransferase [Cohnella nanjingensis]MBB6672796.1 GNAT family N-acetyltransferase [Cohnella nanjingensis]
MRYEIRSAVDEELPVVHRIMREAFGEYRERLNPPPSALKEEVEDIRRKLAGRGGALLVWLGDEPVGSAQYYFSERYMYIGRVSILERARRRGIGSGTMAYLERLAIRQGYSETRIEVRASLLGNVALYRKLGYAIVRRRTYPDGKDGWFVMRKKLSGRTGMAEEVRHDESAGA